MGLGGVEGPPKKKLKQAQLNFCISTEKTSNKRKLSDSSDGLALKLFRKDPETPKPQLFDKENLAVESIGKSKDDVPAKVEQKIDVVVLDDESKDGQPGCDIAEGKVVRESIPKQENTETQELNVSQGSKNEDAEDQQFDTETTKLIPDADTGETISLSKDAEKAVGDYGLVNSGSNDVEESAESDAENARVTKNEADTEDSENRAAENSKLESKLDNSPASDQGDMSTSVVLSSEDEQAVGSPILKTPPNRKTALTPKSSSKKAERERQREEKLRLKKEKEEQRRKEKEEKEKKKQEELRLKEEEKKKKEDDRKRKEEERKRKEEERKKKEEAKEEERRKKEEEKKKKEELKEEDRRKKEEARLAEERKESLAKAAFTKFFITEKTKPGLPKKDEIEAHSEKTDRTKFMPFPVKSDMRLAMQVRRTLTEEERNVLSRALSSGEPTGVTYLEELKNGRKPMTSPATWPLSDEQHDVIIVEFVDDDKAEVEQETKSSSKSKGVKAKLLQFHENRRPPYWGTWRKPSGAVGPRRPLGQDEVLDYEVDSDSEWEDEEEGEDIDKEDRDSDKEEADDENVGENGYELDNTFVPHGYLSDEEAAEAEDGDSVEDQKLKLTVLKQEFDQEVKSRTLRLQPRLLGCVYISNTTFEVSKSIYEPLMKLRCKWDDDPIDVTSPAVVECSPSPSLPTKFPSSMVEKLAKVIHGNRSSMKALISEFIQNCDKDTQLSSVSKRAVFLKVKEIAAKTFSSECGRLVWAVNPDLCREFGLEPITDPQKTVPAMPPAVESPKPKASPLAVFLKKTPQGPVKRISTTPVREGPSETPSSRGIGASYVDTPRPKSNPHVSVHAGHTGKPVRRVSTTLLSSVAGPVKNKTFNVSEIDNPRQSPLYHKPETTSASGSTVKPTGSRDDTTPQHDEPGETVPPMLAVGKLGCSPGVASSDSAAPHVPDSANPLEASLKDAVGDRASQSFEPVPMETGPSVPASDVELPTEGAKMSGPKTTDLAGASPIDPKPSSIETDGQPHPPSSNDAAPRIIAADAKPPNPPTPSSIRKRVPLITLSKSVSKDKPPQSTGKKVPVADIFCQKPAKKEVLPKPASLDPPAVEDLTANSN